MCGITQEYLKSVLKYNKTTGVFTWLVQKNGRYPAGSVAGSDKGDGYLRIMIDGKRYKAHRLAFLYVTGRIPDIIDHKNRLRHDNRWRNLREVSAATNAQNRTHTNRELPMGVSIHKMKSGNKFKAGIHFTQDGKKHRVHLGLFDCAKQAGEAYMNAKKIYHPKAYQ